MIQTFVAYCGKKYPPKHPQQGRDLPEGVTFYAVPGGGIADRLDIQCWADRQGITPLFRALRDGL